MPPAENLSPERVKAELERLLCGPAAAPVLREYVDVIGVVLPELLPMVGFMQNNPHHRKDVWEHTLTVLENIPAEPALRWAALLHDVEKPSCCTTDEEGIRHFKGHQEKSAATAEKILRRLHAETRLITEVTELIKIHDIRFPATVEMATRWAGRWGEKRFCGLPRCAGPIPWDRPTRRRRSLITGHCWRPSGRRRSKTPALRCGSWP